MTPTDTPAAGAVVDAGSSEAADAVGAPWPPGWPWWGRVVLGAVLLPAGLVAAGGLLWLLGTALAPVIGPDGPLGGNDVVVTGALWVALPALVVGAVVLTRRRAAPSAPATREVARGGPPAVAADPLGVDPAPSAGASPLDALAQAAVGLAAALVLVWPFTASPGDDRWVGAFDAPYNAWLGWRIGEAMRAGTWLPTTVPDALWPVGVDLLLTDGLLPAYVTGLLNLVGLDPYVAYDLTLLIGVGLSIWAGRRLGLALTDRPWIALAGGLAYAAAPLVAAPVQAHVAFVWSFAVPLLVRRAVLEARGGRQRPLLLAGLLVLAFLCSAYHLVFGGLAYVLVGLLWPGSALRRPPALARMAAAGLVALVVLSPFVASRVSFERDERAAGGEDQTRVADAFLLSADALSVVTPPDELLVDVPGPRPSLGPVAFASLRIAFPGVALLAGGGIALVLRRRGAAALVATAGVLWLASLGPALHWGGRYPVDDALVGTTGWLPFRLVLEVPGLGNLRAPYRASFALAAVLAAAAVLGLAAVVEHLERRAAATGDVNRVRRARVGVVAVVAGALALGLLGPLPTSDLGLTGGQRAALGEVAARGGDGEAVLVVPAGCRLDDPRIVALQIEHGQPSLGCSTSRAATPWASELAGTWGASEGLQSLWCGDPAVGALFADDPAPVPLTPTSLDALRADLGVRFVVVDGGGADPTRCPWLAEGVALLGERGEVLVADGGWTVLDLGPVDP